MTYCKLLSVCCRRRYLFDCLHGQRKACVHGGPVKFLDRKLWKIHAQMFVIGFGFIRVLQFCGQVRLLYVVIVGLVAGHCFDSRAWWNSKKAEQLTHKQPTHKQLTLHTYIHACIHTYITIFSHTFLLCHTPSFTFHFVTHTQLF